MTMLINAHEMCSALREMISEESTHNPAPFLSGERETVFRQMFTFYYPDFQDNLRKTTPGITFTEELLCMLTVLQSSQADITRWTSLSPEELKVLWESVRKKMDLGPADLLGERLYKMLE